MDTKSSKCVHLVEGGTNGSQYVNMAPMGKTSLGRVTHARKRQQTSFTNLETHGDGSGYLACDTCSSGVPNEIVPAGIVPIGNILVGNNIGFQTRTKGLLVLTRSLVVLDREHGTPFHITERGRRCSILRRPEDLVNSWRPMCPGHLPPFCHLRKMMSYSWRSPSWVNYCHRTCCCCWHPCDALSASSISFGLSFPCHTPFWRSPSKCPSCRQHD